MQAPCAKRATVYKTFTKTPVAPFINGAGVLYLANETARQTGSEAPTDDPGR